MTVVPNACPETVDSLIIESYDCQPCSCVYSSLINATVFLFYRGATNEGKQGKFVRESRSVKFFGV